MTCTCNPGWDQNGDHCYYFSNFKTNWADAEDFCQSNGTHLASVNSMATNNYMVSELATRGIDKAWFGGNDIEEEGTWTWTDRSSWGFTFWNKGQPNNGMGLKQDCLQYDRDVYKWDDDYCSRDKVVVCGTICRGKNHKLSYIHHKL